MAEMFPLNSVGTSLLSHKPMETVRLWFELGYHVLVLGIQTHIYIYIYAVG